MTNTNARFKIVDIQRILTAAKKADVSVRVEIEGDKITVETVEERNAVEPERPIVL